MTPLRTDTAVSRKVVVPECHFSATKRGFNGNMSLTFQAIKKLYAQNMNLCYGVFCKFLGDLGVFLGGNSFSQRS